MNTLTIEIGDSLAGERLDRAISVLGDVSRAFASRLIDDGLVRVNDRSVRSRSYRLCAGESLTVDFGGGQQAIPSGINLPILYFDEAMYVIDKPAGLIVHATTQGSLEPSVASAVVALDPGMGMVGDAPDLRPGIYQRLDKSTSGVMGVARTQESFLALKAQVATHAMTRRYRALVEGDVASDQGVIDAPLGRDQRSRTRIAVIAEGRKAVTHFQVLERFGAYTFVELTLETGRTHQIRVHMSAIDHPLVGDRTYGSKSMLLEDRVFLHSHLLRFVHPVHDNVLEVRSELPPELRAILLRMREA